MARISSPFGRTKEDEMPIDSNQPTVSEEQATEIMNKLPKDYVPVVAGGSGLVGAALVNADLDGLDLEDDRLLNTKFEEMIKNFNNENNNEGEMPVPAMTKTIRGFTLSQILAQSLHNEDKQMLEAALTVSATQHSSILNASILRLPQPLVMPLLMAITDRISLRPNRAISLFPWLKALLTCHASYLSTLPAAAQLLQPLHKTIDDRLVTMKAMQKLHGRLDLILEQVKLRQQVLSGVGEAVFEEPMTVYDESESEQEDDEDLPDEGVDVDMDDEEMGSDEDEESEEDQDGEDDDEEDEDSYDDEE